MIRIADYRGAEAGKGRIMECGESEGERGTFLSRYGRLDNITKVADVFMSTNKLYQG